MTRVKKSGAKRLGSWGETSRHLIWGETTRGELVLGRNDLLPSHIPDGANVHRQCLFLSIHEIQYIYEINNKKYLEGSDQGGICPRKWYWGRNSGK